MTCFERQLRRHVLPCKYNREDSALFVLYGIGMNLGRRRTKVDGKGY
uniref:Uncharacterized protein n=1 Tax=Arundo donax TaxID=35708 RepID=A0A0A9A1C2_ARUDO